MKKATEKKHKDLAKKGEKGFFFLEKSVQQGKKETEHEEGGQRESEHQKGTYKERKHGKSQNMEKKKRET